MKRYAILYDFKSSCGKATDDREIEAENEKEAREKFFKIMSEYKNLRIRKIISIQ